jgi:hypothetical protein
LVAAVLVPFLCVSASFAQGRRETCRVVLKGVVLKFVIWKWNQLFDKRLKNAIDLKT